MVMNYLVHTSRSATVVFGVVALAACSKPSGESTETTAAKVASARTEALQRLDESTKLVTEMRAKVPDSVASRTKCVVVIPSMVKGGVIIGGQSGKGFATCEAKNGWSAPAPVSIAGGTFGAQLGVESTELVGLVTSEKGRSALSTGNFRVGVDASATAGPVGTGVSKSTDVAAGGDLVSYSRSKGLFAGANLDGTTITSDGDATRALYGQPRELNKILAGQVDAPEGSQGFLGAVRTAFAKHPGVAFAKHPSY